MDAEQGPSRIAQELLDRIREGDTDALDELIRAVDKHFRKWVRRERGHFPGVANFEMTDDLSQDVWVRVIGLIRGGADLPSKAEDFERWLEILLAKNLQWTMYDRHRRHFGRVVRANPGVDDVPPPPRRAHLVNGVPTDDPALWETSGPGREDRELALLMELIEKLPEDQRDHRPEIRRVVRIGNRPAAEDRSRDGGQEGAGRL